MASDATPKHGKLLEVTAFELSAHSGISPKQARELLTKAIEAIPDQKLQHMTRGQILIIA